MLPLRSLAALALVVAFALPAFPQAKQPKGPMLPEGTTADRDVAYGPHERNKLDVFAPKGDGPFPVVVLVHGGGWQGGSKENLAAVLFLVREGYAVAAINYRLSQHAVFPAQIQDCQAAVRWLRANAKKYKLDPERFGAWGSSAGGHLVALMGTAGDAKEFATDANKGQSARVKAVCDWFGPTDLIRLSPAFATDNPVTKLLGGTTGAKKDLATLANPITHVTKDDAPVLVLHGDKDPLVPLSQSELFVEALKTAGVENELVVIKDGGHGGPGFMTEENREKILGFFKKHLKGK